MQPVTGRVREHVEHVVLGPGAVGGRRERVLALPVLLPLAVERRVVVRGHSGGSRHRTLSTARSYPVSPATFGWMIDRKVSPTPGSRASTAAPQSRGV